LWKLALRAACRFHDVLLAHVLARHLHSLQVYNHENQ
jgi:hypothetical protein